MNESANPPLVTETDQPIANGGVSEWLQLCYDVLFRPRLALTRLLIFAEGQPIPAFNGALVLILLWSTVSFLSGENALTPGQLIFTTLLQGFLVVFEFTGFWLLAKLFGGIGARRGYLTFFVLLSYCKLPLLFAPITELLFAGQFSWLWSLWSFGLWVYSLKLILRSSVTKSLLLAAWPLTLLGYLLLALIGISCLGLIGLLT